MNPERERERKGKKLESRRSILDPWRSDVSSNSRLMDLSIPVRVEMKYAGGSLAVATWDDRRPICVRRPEATGALLMRGPDSSLSLSPPRKLHVTHTNVLSRVISPEYTGYACWLFPANILRPFLPKRRFFTTGARRFFFLLRNHHVRIEIEYWIKKKNTKILCERSKECIERRTRSAEFKCSSWKWSGKGKFVEREITLGAGRRMDECFWRIEKERVVKRHSLDSWPFPRLIRSFKLVPFHRSCCTGIEASCVRNYRNEYCTEFELEGITLTK